MGCEKPIDPSIVIRKKTRSEAYSHELQDYWLKPMIGLEIYPALIAAIPMKADALKPSHFATIEFTPSYPINTFHSKTSNPNKAQVPCYLIMLKITCMIFKYHLI